VIRFVIQQVDVTMYYRNYIKCSLYISASGQSVFGQRSLGSDELKIKDGCESLKIRLENILGL